jgi:hypothetical protein
LCNALRTHEIEPGVPTTDRGQALTGFDVDRLARESSIDPSLHTAAERKKGQVMEDAGQRQRRPLQPDGHCSIADLCHLKWHYSAVNCAAGTHWTSVHSPSDRIFDDLIPVRLPMHVRPSAARPILSTQVDITTSPIGHSSIPWTP